MGTRSLVDGAGTSGVAKTSGAKAVGGGAKTSAAIGGHDMPDPSQMPFAPNQPATTFPIAQTSSGSGGGSSASARTASVAAPAPVAPAPLTDVDWFNQDSVYRGEAGRSLADLTGQLAQIMADRDQNYQQLDGARENLTRGRQADLTGAGQDFAGRGLLGSGLFAGYTDKLGADYARQGEGLDQSQNQLIQQYGNRGAQVDLSGISDMAQNGNGNLNSIYGLLGALGLSAGNAYQGAIGQSKASSAGRAAAPLVQTTGW
jgi:hypothetical protein